MRSALLAPIASLIVLAAACSDTAISPPLAPPADANFASVHLKGGRNAEPSFNDGGLYLAGSGELSGLGNGNIVVELTATGDPEAVCQNPGSKDHEPPGQNPAPITLTGVVEIPEAEIKNGNVAFAVETALPVNPVPGAPDCSNPNWTELILDIAFTSTTITVYQPATLPNDPKGPLVLTVSCTFAPATSDGAVLSGTVTCTQS